MAEAFTPEQHAASLASRDRIAAGELKTKDFHEAMREMIAHWDKEAPSTHLGYRFPCGTNLKIVCLESAREKCAKANGKAPAKVTRGRRAR